MTSALRVQFALARRSARFAATPQHLTRRTLSCTPQCQARKDSQDKDSMVVEPAEYSKSGSDSQAAQKDSAFSRDKTRPEEQQEGGANDSLNNSPANHDFSKPDAATKPKSEGSAAEDSNQGSPRERTSGGASPKKSGK